MEIQTSKVLYLVGGPNGSGKSTLVEQIFGSNPKIKFVNADNIAREKNCSPASTSTGFALFEEIDNAFSSHASFIYETTLSGKFDNKLIKRAKNAGYSIEFIYVIVSSVDENILRVHKRAESGLHNVKDQVVRLRRKKSLFHFDSVCKQSDHWSLYDNDKQDALCTLVAQGCLSQEPQVIDKILYNNFIQYKQDTVNEYLAEIERSRAARIARVQNSAKK